MLKNKQIRRAVDQIQQVLDSSSPPVVDRRAVQKPGVDISVTPTTPRTITVAPKKQKTPPGMMRVIQGATITGATINFGGDNDNFEQELERQLKMPHNKEAKVTYVPMSNDNDGGGDSLDATIAHLEELVGGEIDIPPQQPKKPVAPNTLDKWEDLADKLCPKKEEGKEKKIATNKYSFEIEVPQNLQPGDLPTVPVLKFDGTGKKTVIGKTLRGNIVSIAGICTAEIEIDATYAASWARLIIPIDRVTGIIVSHKPVAAFGETWAALRKP